MLARTNSGTRARPALDYARRYGRLVAIPMRHPTLSVTLITVLAAALRVFRLAGRSLNLDEGYSIFLARANPQTFWTYVWGSELNMALYYACLRIWCHVAKDVFGIRLLSVVFGSLSVPLIYLLGQRLFNREVGVTAALLLAVHPYAIRISQLARSYSLVVLLLILSSLFLVSVRQTGRWSSVAGYAVSAAAAVYSHFFAALVICSQAVALAFGQRTNRDKKLLVSFAALGLLLVPSVIFLIHSPKGGLDWVAPLNMAQLGEVLSALTLSKARALVYVIAWGIALVAAIRSSQSEYRWSTLFVMFGLCLPVILAVMLSVVRPLLVDRYLTVCLPASVLLAAAGIVALTGKIRWLGAILLFSWFSFPRRQSGFRPGIRNTTKTGEQLFSTSSIMLSRRMWSWSIPMPASRLIFMSSKRDLAAQRDNLTWFRNSRLR